MAGNSRILTVRVLSDASKVGVGLGEASAKYGKFAQALGTKSGTAGVSVGNSLVDGIDKALGTGLKVVGGAAAVVLGTALTKGFQRLQAIDQATAKLQGLGHSAKTVETIMDNSLASVRGTAYGLGSAATVAAQVVAAGIQPGRELESTLKLVADSATISGRSMEDMGAIWAKVAAKNKLQGEVINQLTTAGIPILQLLADHYGTTAEAASDMVSRGEVDFAAFSAAMKAGMGGAALESGATFQGAWENTLAALGRIGENLLAPLFLGAKEGLQGLPALLQPVEEWAREAGQAIGDMAQWISENQGLLQGLGITAAVVIGILLGFRTVIAVMSAYNAVVAVVKAAQIGYAAASYAVASATYGTAAASYAGAAGTLAQNVAMVAGKAIFLAQTAAAHALSGAQWLLNAAVAGGQWLGQTAAMLAYKAAALAQAAASKVVAAGQWLMNAAVSAGPWIAQTAAIVAYKAVMLAQAAASKVVAAAQWALNAAMSANPIGLIIIAVVALVAAFVWLWNNVEGFRNFFIGVWDAIVAGATAAWQWIVSGAEAAFSWISSAVAAVGDFFVGIWEFAVAAVSAYFQAWQVVIGAVVGWIQSAVAAVGAFFASAWQSAVAIAQGIFQGFQSAVAAVTGGIRSAVQGVASFFENAWSSAVSVAKGIFETFKQIVTNVFNAIMAPINAVRSAIEGIINVARSVGNAIGGILGFSAASAAPALPAGAEALMSPFARHQVSPLASRGRRAPSLRNVLAAGAGGAGGVTIINVTGGLDSADAIARRVEDVLNRRERRAGGVTIARRSR